VKPTSEDGSIGIDTGSVVESIKELMERIHYIQQEFDSPALIEEYIEGREIYAAIIGNENPEVLPMVELDLSKLPKGTPKIAGKEDKPINLRRIPNVTFCHPEIGSVGLTEAKARQQGHNVKVGKFPFTANSRASIVGEHEGFIKIISDADYGEILGVHIIGPQATELIAEAVAAMEAEATVEDLTWTIHAHPTLAEAMLDAANSVYGMAINA